MRRIILAVALGASCLAGCCPSAGLGVDPVATGSEEADDGPDDSDEPDCPYCRSGRE